MLGTREQHRAALQAAYDSLPPNAMGWEIDEAAERALSRFDVHRHIDGQACEGHPVCNLCGARR